MEIIIPQLRGIYRDILLGPDNRIIFDTGWRPNAIADSCRILLARLMKGEIGDNAGITYLAVGQGKAEWDTTPPTTTDLQFGDANPAQIQPLQLGYLQPGTTLISNDPTRCLQIKALLAHGQPPIPPGTVAYPLREFGLFGRAGGQDYMIDYVRHPVIQKEENMTLTRFIQLTF